MRKKSIFQVFGLCVAVAALFSSCLNSDESSVTLYGDAAISSFSLGTLNQYQYVQRPSTGKRDSLAKIALAGTSFKMSIDQLKHEIYNLDSLPYGTDVKKVVCTVASKNSGGIALVGIDGTQSWYVATDSIDFSVPRTFRIFSSNGSHQRDYKVWLNVKKDSSQTFGWEQTASEPLLASMAAGMKALWLKGRLVVFGPTEGVTHAVASADGKSWRQLGQNINTPFSADAWQNVVLKGGYVYMLSGSTLLRSEDAETWEQVDTRASLKRLFGAGTRELFAIGTNDSIMASTDGGTTWATEQLDESTAYLPTQGMASICFSYAQSDQTDYVLLVGNDGKAMRSWRKLSTYNTEKPEGRWVYMPVDAANGMQLPVQTQLSLVNYAGKVLAIASNALVYQTRDQGISWQTVASYQLPSNVAGSLFAMTADDANNLWVVSNAGWVLQGKLR